MMSSPALCRCPRRSEWLVKMAWTIHIYLMERNLLQSMNLVLWEGPPHQPRVQLQSKHQMQMILSPHLPLRIRTKRPHHRATKIPETTSEIPHPPSKPC